MASQFSLAQVTLAFSIAFSSLIWGIRTTRKPQVVAGSRRSIEIYTGGEREPTGAAIDNLERA
ncbi:hypothetical protein L208DRAFT_1399114 [Tricholoma matsutake]|nr:hypothetical protein L208DRAFT_1399114 [Tricholoma matsutake 945]